MKYIVYLVVILIIIFNCYKLGQNSIKQTIIEKTDTITITDTVVIVKPKLDTVYLTKYVTDTLYTTDSVKVNVNVPISTTIYKDSTYYAEISGFKASLDVIKVFPRETTIYKEKVREIAGKQPLITHGIQVGVGYLPISKKIEPYIGYGVQINF